MFHRREPRWSRLLSERGDVDPQDRLASNQSSDKRTDVHDGVISVLGRLLLLFIMVPFVELALLFWLADLTDWKLTFGLVVFTGIVGALLAKSQGLRAWQRVQQQLGTGQAPTDALLDAAMILVAGALLLTPGLLTDAFGFSLLLPIGRRFYRSRLRAAFRRHVHVQPMQPGDGPRSSSEIIDVEVISPPEDR